MQQPFVFSEVASIKQNCSSPPWAGCPEGGVGFFAVELIHPALLRPVTLPGSLCEQHRPPKEGISDLNNAKSLRKEEDRKNVAHRLNVGREFSIYP